MSETKPPPPPKPIACIRVSQIGNVTLCSRCVSDKEFLFTDQEYAAKLYDPRTNKLLPSQLSACEQCCDVFATNVKRGESAGFGGADLRNVSR